MKINLKYKLIIFLTVFFLVESCKKNAQDPDFKKLANSSTVNPDSVAPKILSSLINSFGGLQNLSNVSSRNSGPVSSSLRLSKTRILNKGLNRVAFTFKNIASFGPRRADFKPNLSFGPPPECGSKFDTTYNEPFIQENTTSNFFEHMSYNVTCDGDNIPDLAITDTTSFVYNSDSASLQLNLGYSIHLISINPNDPNAVVTETGFINYNAIGIDKTPSGITTYENYSYDLANLVSSGLNGITGGNIAFTTTGLIGIGSNWEYSGNISFTAAGLATLYLGNISYTADLVNNTITRN